MGYAGTKDDLNDILKSAGFTGTWKEEGEKYVFRSNQGAIINWWPATKKKTLQVQGDPTDAAKLKKALADAGVLDAGLTTAPSRTNLPADPQKAKVFVVHGHDETAREQLELVLHRLGLDPFVLQNTSGKGLTIIEALEAEIHSDNGPKFGIVLLTPDDIGRSRKADPKDEQPRARQNVVLEMGMLLSRLGRSKVAILKKGHLELPSDASGILYVGFNDHVRETVAKLSQRLIDAGFKLKPEQITSASS
ncbi:TIR domain-containing protein [Myxococcus virescens]|uniref:TIR domain-containing protein n=1 Tax=Myxococcus virescens TaxID=83456 RepID=UPI003DA681AE